MCFFPGGPDLLISSGVVVVVFGVYELFDDGMGSYSECVFGHFLKFVKKIYYFLIHWIEDKFLQFMFRCRHRLGFFVLPSENC